MAFLVGNNDTLTVRGTLDLSAGTVTFKATGQIARSALSQEANSLQGVPFTDFRVWDSLTSLLPQTTSTSIDDLSIVEGTWGTDAPTLQTCDCESKTSITQYARVMIPIGPEYDLGESFALRVSAKMLGTTADGSATADLEVYANDGTGDVGSDLCETAAQSINSTSAADKDFVITGGSIAQGDVLDCRLSITVADTSTTDSIIAEVCDFYIKRDVKG